jgi:hypothetical protein
VLVVALVLPKVAVQVKAAAPPTTTETIVRKALLSFLNDDSGEPKMMMRERVKRTRANEKQKKQVFCKEKINCKKKTEKREGRSSKKAKFFTRKKGENDESIKKSSCQRMN